MVSFGGGFFGFLVFFGFNNSSNIMRNKLCFKMADSA